MICSYGLTSPSLTDYTSAACLVSTMLIEECKWSTQSPFLLLLQALPEAL